MQNKVLGLFVALQAADLATTVYGLQHGQKEHNAMLLSAAEHIGMVPAVVLAKTGCVLAAIYFYRMFKGAWGSAALTIGSVFYLYITIGNILAIAKS